MYYLLFCFFYLLSLIPWPIIYLISSCIAFVLQHIFRYRKKVLEENINGAFPNLSKRDKQVIINQFYVRFTDNFIELLKLLSISKKGIKKRFEINFPVCYPYLNEGKSVQVMSAHFFNWEYLNICGGATFKYCNLLGIYMPIENKYFERLMKHIRERFHSKMLSAWKVLKIYHTCDQGNFVLGVIADQNPTNPKTSFWLPFLGRMTAFTQGPERIAKRYNNIVLFADIYRKKRGYYKCTLTLVTDNPKEMARGALTVQVVNMIQTAIYTKPSNYLWSHKRWKLQYDPIQYKDNTLTPLSSV
ncbi:MAG: lysophospholipid acyltransferase family protein [Phycisphaerales bacterium]|nr:lysophospholipid acyltransferase family protein [Phycisphaerales bacterium]